MPLIKVAPSYSQGAAKTYPGSRIQICAIVIHPTKIDISTFVFDYTVHLHHVDEINVVWFVLFYYAFVSNSVFSSKNTQQAYNVVDNTVANKRIWTQNNLRS